MQTTIYIREEDIELWQALQNKSQWIHDMLNGNETDLERRIRTIVKQELALLQSQYQ